MNWPLIIYYILSGLTIFMLVFLVMAALGINRFTRRK